VDVIVPILVGAVAIIVGVGVGYFVRKNISEAKIGDAEKRAQEILDKANDLEEQIGKYDLIAHAMSYPYQKFGWRGKRTWLGACSYPHSTEIALDDRELAKLIENYCRDKIKSLRAEMEAL
jgi:hypothetical protein